MSEYKLPQYKEENITSELQGLIDLRTSLADKDIEVYYAKSVEFSKKLKEKYSMDEINGCRAYHLIIGSTPVLDKITKFDFEGDDSCGKFLVELDKELSVDNAK